MHWQTHADARTLSHCRIWDCLKNESDVFQRLQTEQMLKAPWRFVGVKEEKNALLKPDAASVALYSVSRRTHTLSLEHTHACTHAHTLLQRPSGSARSWSIGPHRAAARAIMQPVENGRSSSGGGEEAFLVNTRETQHMTLIWLEDGEARDPLTFIFISNFFFSFFF